MVPARGSRRGAWLLSIGALAVPLVACRDDGSDAGPTDATTSRVTMVSQANDGGTVQLGVGEELRVVLSGNPTTGYTWAVDESSTAPVEQRGEPVFDAESTALGAPGTLTLIFRAFAAGSGSLVIDYVRAFEPDVEPQQTFDIMVAVG